MLVLVVDDEEEIRDLVAMSVESVLGAQTLQAASGMQAIALLKETAEIALVVCDNRMPEGDGGQVFEFMKSAGIAAPFILVSADSPDEIPAFRANKPFAAVRKPMVVRPLMALLRSAELQRLLVSPAPTSPIYCRVSVNTLLRMGVLYADVYLRLGDGHFVKAMNRGDSFVQADADRFLTKKMTKVYFPAEQSEALLRGIEKNLATLSEMLEVSAVDTVHQHISPSLEIVRDLTAALGWDEGLQRVVNENVNVVIKSFSRSPEMASLLRKLLANQRRGVADYAATIAYVSCGIVQTLGWVSDLTHYKLTLAAMLQDLPLSDEEVDQMTELEGRVHDPVFRQRPEGKSFVDHPRKAAETLLKWESAPADVDTIIQQHHEAPDGSGFPFGIHYARISPLAAVQIVARDIVDYYREKGSDADAAQFLSSREVIYSHGVFKKVLGALAMVVASENK